MVNMYGFMNGNVYESQICNHLFRQKSMVFGYCYYLMARYLGKMAYG